MYLPIARPPAKAGGSNILNHGGLYRPVPWVVPILVDAYVRPCPRNPALAHVRIRWLPFVLLGGTRATQTTESWTKSIRKDRIG
jgi:hypothetical protein